MMDNLTCWIANKLPRRLAYWCAVRVMAHASWVHSATEIGALSPADVLRAWAK